MFNIYYADCVGREDNCLYPHNADVTDKASLRRAVAQHTKTAIAAMRTL